MKITWMKTLHYQLRTISLNNLIIGLILKYKKYKVYILKTYEL